MIISPPIAQTKLQHTARKRVHAGRSPVQTIPLGGHTADKTV